MDKCEEVQIERALVLLELAQSQQDRPTQFALEVAALHLARAIPDYWYTTARLVAQASNSTGVEAQKMIDGLSKQLEDIFVKARHYRMLDALRRWDFHWEPLIDPMETDSTDIYRRSAPMRLTSGTTPNSSAGVVGFEPVFTGSGRRVGRANYYEVQQARFLDEEAGQVLPLTLAICQFLEDLPACGVEAMTIPAIKSYFEHPLRRPSPMPSDLIPPEILAAWKSESNSN